MTKPKPIYNLPCNLYRCLAKALISKYGLEQQGWRMRTMRKDKWIYYFALGQCDLKHKTIWLNFDQLKKRSFNFVRGTIIHELAHAITRAGHTPEWKAQCVAMGIKGRVCAPPIRRCAT